MVAMTQARWPKFFGHDHRFQELSPAAFGLYVRGAVYAVEAETDGFVSEAFATVASANTPALVQSLIVAGLWVASPGGYTAADFLRFNPSAAKARAESQRLARNVNRYRQRRGVIGGSIDSVIDGVIDGSIDSVIDNKTPSCPDPSIHARASESGEEKREIENTKTPYNPPKGLTEGQSLMAEIAFLSSGNAAIIRELERKLAEEANSLPLQETPVPAPAPVETQSPPSSAPPPHQLPGSVKWAGATGLTTTIDPAKAPQRLISASAGAEGGGTSGQGVLGLSGGAEGPKTKSASSPKAQSSKAAKAQGSSDPRVVEVFEFWRETMKSPRSTLTPSAEKYITGALAQWPVADCKLAIVGCTRNDWLMGRDPKATGGPWNGLDTIFAPTKPERTVKLIQAGEAPSPRPGLTLLSGGRRIVGPLPAATDFSCTEDPLDRFLNPDTAKAEGSNR